MKTIKTLIALLKSNFFAGVLIVIPFGVIAWIIVRVITLIWSLHELMPDQWWLPDTVLSNPFFSACFNLAFMGIIAFGLALIISILGWVSKRYVGRKALNWLAEVISHIPVIRSVYSALDQLLKTISATGGQQFSRVVYLEFPRKGVWTLGFVTGPARGVSVPEHHLNVYVPTTPNPTGGYYLIVSESEVRESHMRVEDAFKSILSLGMAQGDR
jgi:uncharacterized membrane protein